MATITFRTDAEVDRALAELSGKDRDRSQVIRDAILAAARRRAEERLHEEAQRLAGDPADVEEARRVLADLEPLRAW